MPRWTRRYWTPSTALAFAVFLLSAGTWWGTYKTAPDVQGLRKDLGLISATMSSECIRGCVLKREDISVLESHVNELWDRKKNVDAEMQLNLKPIPDPQPKAPAEVRKGKIHR